MIRPALLRLIQYAAPNDEEMRLLMRIRNLTSDEHKCIFTTIMARTTPSLKNSQYYYKNIIKQLNKTQDANTINEG